MLPALRGRAFKRGGAHHVDDAIEHCRRHALATPGIAVACGAFFDNGVIARPASRRAQAFVAPHHLSVTGVDAATESMLKVNGIPDNNFVADRNRFHKVIAPNRGDFMAHGVRAGRARDRMHDGLRGLETNRNQVDGSRQPRAADHGAG